METKVSKGDVVLLRFSRSSTSIGGASTVHEWFDFGIVKAATHSGKAKAVFVGAAGSCVHDGWNRLYTLARKNVGDPAAFVAGSPGFDNLDDARAYAMAAIEARSSRA